MEQLIADDFMTVRRGTHIHTKTEIEYMTMDQKMDKLPIGRYLIQGFYANAVKLIGLDDKIEYIANAGILRHCYRNIKS